jgi:hypothetical protein
MSVAGQLYKDFWTLFRSPLVSSLIGLIKYDERQKKIDMKACSSILAKELSKKEPEELAEILTLIRFFLNDVFYAEALPLHWWLELQRHVENVAFLAMVAERISYKKERVKKEPTIEFCEVEPDLIDLPVYLFGLHRKLQGLKVNSEYERLKKAHFDYTRDNEEDFRPFTGKNFAERTF